MFELTLMTLTVLVMYGGLRRELVHYLEGLDLGIIFSSSSATQDTADLSPSLDAGSTGTKQSAA